MITHLEIKGFKSLVDVSIELGAVNVFIGANGSGKSNLLEAVGVLSAIVHNGPQSESFRYRGVRVGDPSSYLSSLRSDSSAQIKFVVSNGKAEYEVEFGPDGEDQHGWRVHKELMRFAGEELFDVTRGVVTTRGRGSRSGKSFRYPPLLESGSAGVRMGIVFYEMAMDGYGEHLPGSEADLENLKIREVVKNLGLFLSEIYQYAIYSPSTPQLRGSLDDIRREPLGLGGSGLSQAIDEMMKGESDKLGPFDLEDVYELIDWADSLQTESATGSNPSILGGPTRLRIGDRFMGPAHKAVSPLEASEGALYVLFMLALVGHPQSPKFFAVDNFDQALHPRLARALTRLVSEQIVDDGSRQMLATTHNPLVLDGLDILDDRIRLFTVDRDSGGATQISRVQVTPELMAQAENGFSLSQLWTMGRFGGVPKNF